VNRVSVVSALQSQAIQLVHGIGWRDPLSMAVRQIGTRLKIEVPGATHKLKLHHGLKTNALSWFTATIERIDAKLRPRHFYFWSWFLQTLWLPEYSRSRTSR
jgi:hypothetical protein